MVSVCVFCGSNVGRRPDYERAAQIVGQALARRGLGLVYGGGNVGLMGAVADAALAAGGQVFGVIPAFLEAREVAHAGLTQIEVVTSMHERKARMAELADAFLALPGGYGTLEEFCEIVTWAQLGLHHKPIGLLNVAGYYDALLHLFDHAQNEGFISAALRSLVIDDDDPGRLLDRLMSARPPDAPHESLDQQERDVL